MPNCKRRTDDGEDAVIKIEYLVKEIESLEDQVNTLKEMHTKELQRQAEVFQNLMDEQKEKLQQRIKSATIKIKLLNKQIKRRDTKISDLLERAKQQQILNAESYETINMDFQNTFTHIVDNEERNKNKSSHGRRYTDEVKQFAVTLYYHSPKAYDLCNLNM